LPPWHMPTSSTCRMAIRAGRRPNKEATLLAAFPRAGARQVSLRPATIAPRGARYGRGPRFRATGNGCRCRRSGRPVRARALRSLCMTKWRSSKMTVALGRAVHLRRRPAPRPGRRRWAT
jgi:hypothetical protein